MTHLPTLDILHDLPFTSDSRLLTSESIPILFRQDQRDKVDSRPSLFPPQFSVPYQFPFSHFSNFSRYREEKRHRTDLFSRFPSPTLQNPNAQIPITAPKMAIPPGPRVGRLRLYLIVSYPPAGGISLEENDLAYPLFDTLIPARLSEMDGLGMEISTHCLNPCDILLTLPRMYGSGTDEIEVGSMYESDGKSTQWW
jgi:hypothetical protein